MASSFEKSVKGGTKIKLAPPKSKYVEHLLVATHSGEAGVAEVFRTLKDRLRDSTWTIVFKSLIIVHLMIKEGEKDVTLSYLAEAPRNRLAINTFTDVQTQGQNIRRYSNYLVARAQGFADTKVDYVRSGIGRMKNLSIDKGLLRETESIQDQIRMLVKCDLLGTEHENEISLTAFRLLTKDLMDLFAVMNEAVMNVLSHYFELSKVDAEHAISIYKMFAKQTDQVVQYLSIARQYEHVTKLEIPKIKHAPTSLAASLQEYIDDHDFETNRRQYLAEQQAKDSTKFRSVSGNTSASSKPVQAIAKPSQPEKPVQTSVTQAPSAKPPASDLIDFFGSIENPPQPMAQPPQAQQQFPQPTAQGFQQPYPQPVDNSQMTNPFGQVQAPQFPPPQPLQPNFTGAGFGGYGPQPLQQQPTGSPSTNPFQSGMQQPFGVQQQQQQPNPFDLQQQQQQQQLAQMPQQQQMPQIQQQPQIVQQQSTNPFRQSSMPTGQISNGFPPVPPISQQAQQLQPQSTNPFARNVAQQSPMQTGTPFGQQAGQFAQPNPPRIQAQPTGTNPFARSVPTQQTGSPSNFLTPAVTGSTNPFRQSAFVNQQTGQGWQNAGQGTIGGWEQLDTVPVFPRPGQA